MSEENLAGERTRNMPPRVLLLGEARVDAGLRVPVEGTSGLGLRSYGAAHPAWMVRDGVEGLWRRFRVAARRGDSH